MFSSCGIPSDAKSALGSREVVLPNIDASVSVDIQLSALHMEGLKTFAYLTSDSEEVGRAAGVLLLKIEVLRHLLQDKKMPHKEQLPV